MSSTPTENLSKPSSPLPDALLNVVPDSNGFLDISNKELSGVSERHIRSFAHQVISIDASSNKFTALDFLKFLPRCQVVRASKNQIRRLISLSPLKNELQVLDLGDNHIQYTEHYLSLFTKLKVLNLRNNFLQTFPSINELIQLTILDLSGNDLKNFPNVKRLQNVTTLKINRNLIYTLKDAPNYLPTTLEILEISHNKVADLNEINHLKCLHKLNMLAFEGNPCVKTPYKRFNHRPFLVSKILSLMIIDDEDVNDDDRLVGEFLHTNRKLATFEPDANKHEELVKFLEKECPLNSDPLVNLTPSNPKLLAVREDYLHNKSEDESFAHSTPQRNVRSADRNIRRVSPSPERSATFDSPATFHGHQFDLNQMKPYSKYLSDSTDSVKSSGTVTLTESESVNLNVKLPVIESQENENVAPSENANVPLPTANKMLEYSSDDDKVFSDKSSDGNSPLLPRILRKRNSWTQIVKESPFHSVISEDSEPANKNPPMKPSFSIEDETVRAEETTKTLDRTLDSTQILEKLNELKRYSYDSNKETWDQITKSLKVMDNQLQDLQQRVTVLEASQKQPSTTMEALQMFLPMPSDVQVTKEPNTSNYTLSWDTVVPVQPTIRGYAVYIDGKFYSEVKAPVVRVRGPLSKGQKISLESVSVTNARSLPYEIVINNQEIAEGDKENTNLIPLSILTARSA